MTPYQLTTAVQRFCFACRPIAQPIGLQYGNENCLRLAILPIQTNRSFTGTWGGFLWSSVGSFPAAPGRASYATHVISINTNL